MPPPLDPRQRARIAALTRLSREDPTEMTVEARATFQAQFELQARAECPDCTDKEIQRRAGYLRELFYVRLSAAGVAGQRKKKAGPRLEEDPPSGGGPR